MRIDSANTSEAPAITDLLNEAYRPAEAFLYEGPRATVEEVADRLAKGTFLVSRSEQGLDGCVYLEGRGMGAYLGMLAVSPRCQGAGLGRSLVRAGEAFLRERGAVRLEIEVIDVRPELFGFYERLGFRPTGRRPFPEPRFRQPVQLVVMEKPLVAQDPASRPPG